MNENKSESSASHRAGRRIAIVVPNPCNPDYRVIKQAESLARAGYEVTIFAVKKPDTPSWEELAGVRYLRRPWNVRENFRSWRSGAYKILSEYDKVRQEYRKALKKASKILETRRGSDE